MLKGQTVYGQHGAQTDTGSLALGRNLFRLLPEDVHDVGPVSRAHFHLVADVRLDNRADLIGRLGISPPDGARLSDTGLLFECLLKWSEEAIDQLVGEFAFAFWNSKDERLVLARDIFGHRPLYFHQSKHFFAFASMPSGLHALPEIPYDFDAEFMSEALALLPRAGNRSHFREIERVEPGHLLHITRNGVRSSRYWHPPVPSQSGNGDAHYEEGLRGVFDEAVSSQLRGANGSVGTHLSSGLDSSIVTASAARQFPAGKVTAFTAVPRTGFDGPVPPGTLANEAEIAARTAQLYPNIEHVLIGSDCESPLSGLDTDFLYQQQPADNLCNAVWGRAINREAHRRGLKVLLTGSFGNMSITYSGMHLLPDLLRRGKFLKLVKTCASLARNGEPLLPLGAQVVGPFLPARLWEFASRLRGKVTHLQSYSAVNAGSFDTLRQQARERRYDFASRPRSDPTETRLWAMRRHDGGNYYKGILAEWGLSLRDPTEDKRVVEYCLSIPPEAYLSGGITRSLARRTFIDRLPPEVIHLRKRGYQAADWYEALGRDLDRLNSEVDAIGRCSDVSSALDTEWLKQAATHWPAQGWDRDEIIMKYRWGLLRGVSAGHFMLKVRGTN